MTANNACFESLRRRAEEVRGRYEDLEWEVREAKREELRYFDNTPFLDRLSDKRERTLSEMGQRIRELERDADAARLEYNKLEREIGGLEKSEGEAGK